jgi:hypothetical protein
VVISERSELRPSPVRRRLVSSRTTATAVSLHWCTVGSAHPAARFEKFRGATAIRHGLHMASPCLSILDVTSLARPLPRLARLRARLLQPLEWIILSFNPGSGEEIVLVIEK